MRTPEVLGCPTAAGKLAESIKHIFNKEVLRPLQYPPLKKMDENFLDADAQ